MKPVVVIYDGQCEFCRQSLKWIQQKATVTAIPFQTADLSQYRLTLQQCAKQVFVIADSKTYAAADAIAYLLFIRGNTSAAWFLGKSGNLGAAGYRWIASHRDGLFVKIATKILTALNAKN